MAPIRRRVIPGPPAACSRRRLGERGLVARRLAERCRRSLGLGGRRHRGLGFACRRPARLRAPGPPVAPHGRAPPAERPAQPARAPPPAPARPWSPAARPASLKPLGELPQQPLGDVLDHPAAPEPGQPSGDVVVGDDLDAGAAPVGLGQRREDRGLGAALAALVGALRLHRGACARPRRSDSISSLPV